MLHQCEVCVIGVLSALWSACVVGGAACPARLVVVLLQVGEWMEESQIWLSGCVHCWWWPAERTEVVKNMLSQG